MEQKESLFGELGQVESLQERQRRWNAVTSPAMKQLKASEDKGLKQVRGQFAGVFTRLMARLETRGVCVTSATLVGAATLSYTADPSHPAAALQQIAKHCHREGLDFDGRDLGSPAGFADLLEQARKLDSPA